MSPIFFGDSKATAPGMQIGFWTRVGRRFGRMRVMTIWSDPQKSFVILKKYILNNPVKAGLVHDIEAFPWSSAASIK